MNKYTVEYKMTYTMTVEVEAQDESEAIKKAELLEGEGDEHDVECHGYDVIDCEEEEISDEEWDALKGDAIYRQRRDEA
jgi:hypothetical protein